MWIRTGNVNVTISNGTVNGGSIAPNFIANGAKPGYIFQGPDARIYEILTVPSETQITITPNYVGATASNQAYAIIQLSAAAYAETLAKVQALLDAMSGAIVGTTLKIGSPVEASAALAVRGTLVAFESAGNLRTYFSKNATGGSVWNEFSVGGSGRARMGLIGNNNIVIDYSTDGTVWTNVLTFDITTAPANPRLTYGFPIIPKSYTLATLPTSIAGASIYVTDLGGGAGYLRGDGTGWLRVEPGFASIATAAGADATHNELTDAGNVRLTAALGATPNRTITLGTTNARASARRRYTRTAASTGAATWSIGGLKLLAVGQWCDIAYDGSGWYLSAFGSL